MSLLIGSITIGLILSLLALGIFISFRVFDFPDITAEGSFVCVLGTNGSGKSTLLNAVAGSFLPDGGRITLNGVDVTHWDEHRRAACRFGGFVQGNGAPAQYGPGRQAE